MRKPNDVLGLLSEYGMEILGKYYSILPGLVIENADPDITGKIRAIISSTNLPHDIEVEATPLTFGGGPGFGFKLPLPPIGSVVYLLFLGGNLNVAFWMYAGWVKGKAPLQFNSGDTYGLVTPQGNHIIIKKDKDGKESLDINFKGAVNIRSDVSVTISSPINTLNPTGDNGFNCLGNSENGGWAVADKLAERLNLLTAEIRELKDELARHVHTAPTSGGPTTPPVEPLATNITDFQGVTFVDLNNIS